MSVLSMYVAGISATGIDLLTEASTEVFNGDCSVIEIKKEDLRHKVREGTKDKSIVLVVLDEVSSEECKDIENGLYSSDRYFKYLDDQSLANFLNEKYDLDLQVQEEENLDISEVDAAIPDDNYEEIIEKYNSQLRDKDSIIKTLNANIRELTQQLDEGSSLVDNSKLIELEERNSSLENENLELKNTIANMKNEYVKYQDTLEGLKSSSNSSESQLKDVSEKYSTLKVNYDHLSTELANERIQSSQKSGLIRDKDNIIEKLNSNIQSLNQRVVDLEKDILDKEELIKVNSDLNVKLHSMEIDLSNHKEEIDRLKELSKGKEEELSSKYNIKITELSNEKAELDKSNVELSEKLSDCNDKLSICSEKYNVLREEIDKSSQRYADLQKKLSETEAYLTKANSENIRLLERNKLLESTSNIDSNYDSVVTELSELRYKYLDLEKNIFNAISQKAYPRSSVKVPLFTSINPLENVSFVFSGSTESRKGTYRCIYNKIKDDTNTRYLIVDVTSETAIDYVFGISKFADGIEWFSNGGGVRNYLTPTSLENVSVLSAKLGYINDSFFLSVNWKNRLDELENSGYKVILYAGDLSNLVSRVLFENFSNVGKTLVYVHGNTLGSRSMITNSKGLTSINKSEIGYYDYDKKAEPFYNIMSKSCTCNIISYVRM